MPKCKTKSKRKPRKLPQILTATEQAALIDRGNPRYPSGRRNRMLIQFLLDTGLRLAELCALCWRDIDLQSGRLHVHQGKGARDRILWYPAAHLDALRTWRDSQDGTELVFTSRNNKPLTHRYVQRLISRYALGIGIDRRVTPHLLRHTYASDLLAATGSLPLVQSALGHASIATTLIYTHCVNGALEDAMKDFRGGS